MVSGKCPIPSPDAAGELGGVLLAGVRGLGVWHDHD
jgi:hypothetical protein